MIISDSTSGSLSGIPVKGQPVYYCFSSPCTDPTLKIHFIQYSKGIRTSSLNRIMMVNDAGKSEKVSTWKLYNLECTFPVYVNYS